MHKTVVINAVGLTQSLLGPHTPRLKAFADRAKLAPIAPILPAVTCSVQATYLTGAWPSEHGIVGNGWYFRDECEVKFWRQSNKLVQRPKIWDAAKQLDPSFTCANLFWWYNMYSTADYSVTPRPMYPADGRKIPDVYTQPPELRDDLQKLHGPFPLFQFWGPATSIASTDWIARSAIRVDGYNPTLTLVYLPHLDYCLQRRGPDASASSQDLRELDEVCGRLIDHFTARGARLIILSEYGIEAVSKPVHLNRVLRHEGLLAVRDELGHELLDPGASKAFAVADHQVAHVYVNDRAELPRVRRLIESTAGVAEVLGDDGGKARWHLDHERSGELVAVAAPGAWFTYYYWLDDGRAPDFARTVDIHRKPGYDPAELFVDPSLTAPKLKIAATLLRRKLGFRTLLDVIPLDASLVRGSHGRPPASPAEGALLMTNGPGLDESDTNTSIDPTDVFSIILRTLRE